MSLSTFYVVELNNKCYFLLCKSRKKRKKKNNFILLTYDTLQLSKTLEAGL